MPSLSDRYSQHWIDHIRPIYTFLAHPWASTFGRLDREQRFALTWVLFMAVVMLSAGVTL